MYIYTDITIQVLLYHHHMREYQSSLNLIRICLRDGGQDWIRLHLSYLFGGGEIKIVQFYPRIYYNAHTLTMRIYCDKII